MDWFELAEKYVLEPLGSKTVSVIVFCAVFLLCVYIGFQLAGIGGAIVGAIAGCFLGGWAVYYGIPIVMAGILIGIPVAIGFALLALVIFLISSFWGVGKPA